MSAVLEALRANGVELRVWNGELQVRAPAGREVWAGGVVRKHRDSLLAVLQPLDEGQYLLEERAGILMDSGMTQAEADVAARRMMDRAKLIEEQPQAREALLLLDTTFPGSEWTLVERMVTK